METAGIIVEYNPVHSGHIWQIDQTRRALGEDAAIVCCMSGCWVQSAAPAIADKWLRARLAVMGGADLVLELPTMWAVSSAETFALGGVSLLMATGVVKHLSFGSECGEIEGLQAVAKCLNSREYEAELRRFLDRGLPFAVCRQAAVTELAGAESGALLATPNNNLGIEYLRAALRLGADLQPMTVRREGAGYHEAASPQGSPFISATQARRWIAGGEWERAAPYLVPGERELLQSAQLALPPLSNSVERAFLSRLRTMTAADWAELPDSALSEGLPDRLVRAGRQALSLEEFYELAKTKRYTHARLRRLALWAFLGLRAQDRPNIPPYLRVLAAGERGRVLLRKMRETAILPVLTKTAHARRLEEDCRRSLELEARCTDLYGLCLPHIPPGGREWREGPAIL
ncbi:nucleotidyltransferase family protein [Oscillibacter sp.]|uniref:tRNA(Met) cytidine acetate ligase n=1 Tax=Oscillibacter sp. TaxID=1945593 RepID=UPI0028B135EB|nr:nucleotidyltransferase family protein [Oscillibacter sp.]